MQRPTFFVTLFFVCGLIIGKFFPIQPAYLIFCSIISILTTFILYKIKSDKTNYLILFSILTLGILSQSFVSSDYLYSQKIIASIPPDTKISITAKISDESLRPNKNFIDLKNVIIRSNKIDYLLPDKIRLSLTGDAKKKYDLSNAIVGDPIELENAVLLPLEPISNPDIFDYKAYLKANGIAGITLCWDAENINILSKENKNLSRYFFYIIRDTRKYILSNIDVNYDQQSAPVFKAFLLGDAYYFTDSQNQDFINTGIMHIFAVSGLHVSLILSIFLIFFSILRIPRKTNYILCLIIIFIFTALTNFKPAINRTSIMCCCFLIAAISKYEVESITSLFFSALIILLFDPLAMDQISFQLSFIAAFSVIIIYPTLRDLFLPKPDDKKKKKKKFNEKTFLNKISAYTIDFLFQIIAVNIGLLPIIIYSFGKFTLIGIVANFFLIPIGFIVLATGLLSLLMSVILPYAAYIIGSANTFFISIMLYLAKLFASVPFAFLPIKKIPLFMIGIYYLILFGGIWITKPKDQIYKIRQRINFILIMLILISMIVTFPLFNHTNEDMSIFFLDVGQGDSIYIEFPDGKNMLIDAGRNAPTNCGKNIVAPFLRSRGRAVVNTVMASHSDSDHIGGIPYILENFIVETFLENGDKSESEVYAVLDNLLSNQSIDRITVERGDEIKGIDDVKGYILNPVNKDILKNKSNDNSIILRLVYDEFSIILMGDLEKKKELELIKAGLPLSSDVIKIAHHGSKSSNSERFIKIVNPKIAVISVGKNNPYGHPSSQVLETFKNNNTLIYRTDIHGAITISTDGEKISVKAQK